MLPFTHVLYPHPSYLIIAVYLYLFSYTTQGFWFLFIIIYMVFWKGQDIGMKKTKGILKGFICIWIMPFIPFILCVCITFTTTGLFEYCTLYYAHLILLCLLVCLLYCCITFIPLYFVLHYLSHCVLHNCTCLPFCLPTIGWILSSLLYTILPITPTGLPLHYPIPSPHGPPFSTSIIAGFCLSVLHSCDMCLPACPGSARYTLPCFALRLGPPSIPIDAFPYVVALPPAPFTPLSLIPTCRDLTALPIILPYLCWLPNITPLPFPTFVVVFDSITFCLVCVPCLCQVVTCICMETGLPYPSMVPQPFPHYHYLVGRGHDLV